MQIGAVANELNLSADTLRYYEKIGLLTNISRLSSGLRDYHEEDISRLRFIRRAQRMGFKLEEISQLLEFRQSPRVAKPEVRQLAGFKLQEIKSNLVEIQHLHDELQLLLSLCTDSDDGCPILEVLDQASNEDTI